MRNPFILFIWQMLKNLFSFKYFAENMRSPTNGVLGYISSLIMTQGNKISEEILAARLSIKTTDVVVELGPGSGWGLMEAAKKTPKRLIGVEISPRFRKELSYLQLPVKLEVYGEDAKDMSTFLNSESVDKVFGLNVVYFLDPLEVYTQELYRVMRKGGIGIFGCKFNLVNQAHSEFFKNKDKDKIMSVLKDAGFTVDIQYVTAHDFRANFHAIKFEKT